MVSYNHLLIALSGYTLYAPSANSTPQVLLGAALAALGSIFPDIDHPRSWVGQRVHRISFLIALIFGHRKLFHSGLALLFIWGLSILVFRGGAVFCSNAFCLGYASHLLAD